MPKSEHFDLFSIVFRFDFSFPGLFLGPEGIYPPCIPLLFLDSLKSGLWRRGGHFHSLSWGRSSKERPVVCRWTAPACRRVSGLGGVHAARAVNPSPWPRRVAQPWQCCSDFSAVPRAGSWSGDSTASEMLPTWSSRSWRRSP